MADSSFDIVSKYDLQEVDNAVNQAAKEIATRYDFKNVGAYVKLNGTAITMGANTPERVLAVLDVLQSKLIRRGISLKQLDTGEGVPKAGGKEYRLAGEMKEGIDKEHAKKITQLIREKYPKGVKTQIQGDEIRVSSKSRDTLQQIISMLKNVLRGAGRKTKCAAADTDPAAAHRQRFQYSFPSCFSPREMAVIVSRSTTLIRSRPAFAPSSFSYASSSSQPFQVVKRTPRPLSRFSIACHPS